MQTPYSSLDILHVGFDHVSGMQTRHHKPVNPWYDCIRANMCD